MKRWTIGSAFVALALFASCTPAPKVSPGEVLAVRVTSLPSRPDDGAWDRAPVHAAPLLAQDLVEPRLLAPSTPEVRVQALTDGERLAFRLAWDDAAGNDLPGAARFADACAVQLPRKPGPELPAPQMGETGKGVEITLWRASWQATVDGRPDTINALYPGATVDHYPFEAESLTPGSPEQQAMAKRYAPARALGNPMAGPRTEPVQDLVAEGPGTIEPAPSTRSTGRGVRAPQGWSVMIVRPLPDDLAHGSMSQVAFAVWDGAKQETGSRKMRSVWIPLAVEAKK